MSSCFHALCSDLLSSARILQCVMQETDVANEGNLALQGMLGHRQDKDAAWVAEKRRKQLRRSGVPVAMMHANQELARLAAAMHQESMHPTTILTQTLSQCCNGMFCTKADYSALWI